MERLKYTGERLVSSEKTLQPMRIENLARYQFFIDRVVGNSLLDMGCGDGEGSGFLRKNREWRVFSIDIAGDAISFAGRKYGGVGNGQFTQMDLNHLAFRSGAFDAVISVEVIEHVPDPGIFLSQAKRVLKENGMLMLTTPNRLRTAPPEVKGSLWTAHVREYTPDELLNLLENHFPRVEMWGEYVPVYEGNPLRKIVRRVAPFFKKFLPHALRIRALPTLQYMIKPDLQISDVRFSKTGLEEKPTLVAVCYK